MRSRLRRTRLAGALVAALVLLVGCSSGAAGEPGSAASAPSAGDRATVRFALDWTPNTNHTGLFAAMQQGWFADAGIDVQALPYNTALPDTLVDAGSADFGISFQDNTTVAQAATSPRCWPC